LFYRGLDIIDEALAKGILDENWNIFFVGSDVPLVTFPNGTQPKFLGQISWFEYSSFLKTVDLGLCLMHTPHPSYPPLDVVSSGGVVLTNTYRNKKELYYSKNIICRDLEKKELLSGLEEAIRLVKNREDRKMNYENNSIGTNWEKSFKEAIEYMNNYK
jgi:hypothetical protein